MQFDIRRVKNGCILKVTHTLDEGCETDEVVYQEKHDDKVDCFAEFLWYLSEEYGPSTGRHSPKRIYIRVEPGDKFEEWK